VVDMQTKKVIHSIPVGRSPHGIYFHTHAPRR
jgi:YVTN family beta-propeller protein